MFRRLLVGWDDSAPAAKAFDYALDIARKYGASIDVVAVARPPEFGEEVETEAVLESAQEHFEQSLAALKAQGVGAGVPIDCAVRVGHPAEQLSYHADQKGIDLIVLGHRGRTRLQRWRLGSVSRQVMLDASCPVLVVR